MNDLNNLLDTDDAARAKVITALSKVRRTALAHAKAVEELTRVLQHSRADRETAPPAINQATQQTGSVE